MVNDSVLISEATQRNWSRLSFNHSNKLKSRANKSMSGKFVRPDNYLCGLHLDVVISQIESAHYTCEEIFTYLCRQKLRHLNGCANVAKFLLEYPSNVDVGISISDEILFDAHSDWLGFLYQSSTPEGKRNLQGMYYTSEDIVKKMLVGVELGDNRTFFDPCCGTGAFLMNVGASSLSQLYGVDNDEIAVMIAKANLIALYPEDDNYPQIYCEDYLDDSIFASNKLRGVSYDYIYTNPPWGASRGNSYSNDVIHSKERSSLFFVKAFTQLKQNGVMSFLLPSALLKVKTHHDFRSFVLNETSINSISLYKERFNGVYTDFFSICVTKHHHNGVQSYSVERDNQVIDVEIPANGQTELVVNRIGENEILKRVECRGCYTLKDSIWALGIVTGDNKNKIKSYARSAEYEPIYTGKDINKYILTKPTNYIIYDRAQLQQCAKDEIYRCSEKLVYKFISQRLCFAYDNGRSLFLNSANILIPKIQGMSIKTAMAFLNSDIFSYYYRKKYSDIKVLKGNLLTIPFPQISEGQDAEITRMVDLILNGEGHAAEEVNEYIFDVYGFTPEMITEVKTELYGTATDRT